MKLSRRSFLGHSAIGTGALPALLSTRPVSGGPVPPASMGTARFVDVDGIRTRYFQQGSGEAMVLVHGGHFGLNSGGHTWMPVFPELASRFRVMALDKLGMGLTENPPDQDYTMQATTRHIYRFIEVLGIRQVHLVGHSRGGLPVANIAIEHPELVKTLTIFDSNTLAPGDPRPSAPDLAPEPPPATRASVRQALLESRSSINKDFITDEYVEAQLEVTGNPKIRQAAERLELLRKRFVERNPEKVRSRPALGHNSGTGWWLYQVKDLTLEAITAGRLRTPTLLIWGFNDPTATFQMGSDLFAMVNKSVERAQLHSFNRCGHSPYAEYPREVAGIMANFIQA